MGYRGTPYTPRWGVPHGGPPGTPGPPGGPRGWHFRRVFNNSPSRDRILGQNSGPPILGVWEYTPYTPPFPILFFFSKGRIARFWGTLPEGSFWGVPGGPPRGGEIWPPRAPRPPGPRGPILGQIRQGPPDPYFGGSPPFPLYRGIAPNKDNFWKVSVRGYRPMEGKRERVPTYGG